MVKRKIRRSVRLILDLAHYLRYFPQMLPSLIVWHILPSQRKNLLLEDLDAFYRVEIQRKRLSNITAFYRMMVDYKAFRNVFYYRCSHLAQLIDLFMPRLKSLEIRVLEMGGGIYIQHGVSTQIDARRIGRNFWTNQNVTIGWNGPGNPIIGDNVRVGTGAVVIGPIEIGDNVNIGANATIIKNLPSNCTVVPSPSVMVRKDGKKTRIPI